MIRVAVLGDTHGRADWKKVVEQEKWDRVIFLGDYFDTHEKTTGEEQALNFQDIMAYRAANPHVTTLIGNHDFHYFPGFASERYSGYQPEFAPMFHSLLKANYDQLQVAGQVGEWFCTHAGITKEWCKVHKINTKDLVVSINKAWKERPGIFRFYQGDYSGYGDHELQGPLWVRPRALSTSMEVPKQIVGHTSQKELEPSEALVLADTLGVRQFVILEGQEVKVGRY